MTVLSRSAALLAVTLLPSCTCGTRPSVETPPATDAAPPRRPQSPPGKVHAYPPHAIRSDGVGPYLLGEKMGKVLRELPEGPHLELVQVGRYANWRVARAEGGAIVIGADDENEVAFASVLGPEVARTSDGIAVGAAWAALRPVADGAIRDRELLEHPSLPGVSFLTDAPLGTAPADARVLGVVVTRRGAAPPAETSCTPLAADDADVIAAAKLRAAPSEAPLLRAGCVSGAAGEVIVISDGELALVGGEAGKLKRLAGGPIGEVDFAGALDLDGDHRDEIVFGGQRRSARELALDLHVLRWEAGKLVEAQVERAPAINEVVAAAAGLTPQQIDLAVAVRAARGGLEVGGFFTARRDGALRELAPIQPLALRVDLRKAGAPPAAAPPDGGSATAGDAGPSGENNGDDGESGGAGADGGT